MKTALLSLLAFFLVITTQAQIDDWYLLTKPGSVSSIIPDDTNNDELHLATDMGYIKFNTTSGMVTDFLNLTTQNPAIGHVNNIALNPINNDVAMTLDNGFAVYNGTTTTVYNYDNSGLTLGEAASQFTFLQAEYAKDGKLYLFKEDVFGYQIFDNGTFETEVTTSFRTKDIVENNCGTKAYFAGWNNGLWELEKATTTWTNYTSTNSDLIYDVLLSLFVDSNDLLYIGGFQGLNTMTPSGVWNTYQQLVPPANTIYFPVYDISVNETTGNTLIKSSEPNISYAGICELELLTNTWTNFTNDNTNCLNENVFKSSTFGGDGNIYVAPHNTPFNGFVKKFLASSDSCTDMDINYLDSPDVANSHVITDADIVHASDTLYIGMTKGERLMILAQQQNDAFTGSFANTTEVIPSPGNPAYGLMSQNGKFIVENNNGWVSVDENYNTMAFNHNIPNYLSIASQNAAKFPSVSNLMNIIHKGFDASFNYRMYKSQCDLGTGTCSPPEELFTNDRDFSQNIVYGSWQNENTNQVSVVAVKTDGSGNIKRTLEQYDGTTNGTPTVNWNEIHAIFPAFDPFMFGVIANQLVAGFIPDITTIQTRTEDPANGNSPVETNFTSDDDNDGNNDSIAAVSDDSLTFEEHFILVFRIYAGSPGFGEAMSARVYEMESVINNRAVQLNSVEITDTKLEHNLPEDFIVQKFKLLQYNPTEAILIMLTNYGLLIKSSIDVTGLFLDVEDYDLENARTLIYPNPSDNIVSFSDASIEQIDVYDINGRSVLSSFGNSISVKILSKGIYVVKGKTSENISISRKLIKN